MAWTAEISEEVDTLSDEFRDQVKSSSSKRYAAYMEKAKKKALGEAIRAAKSPADQFDFDVELCAPVIIVPSNGSNGSGEDSSCMTVELGRVLVKSNVVRDDRRRGQEDVLGLALHGLGLQVRV